MNGALAPQAPDRKDIASIHAPVLLESALEALAPRPGGRYLDGTLGLGGHAEALLARAPESSLCGLDRDSQALALARERLAPFGGRVHFFHCAFAEFPSALGALGWPRVDGALLDLGLSSLQLDNSERGFSFHASGPLDMRMDQAGGGCSAWNLVNENTFEELRDCIATFGEEPMAPRIARAIVESRGAGSIETTDRLAEVVCGAYPPAWRKKARRHPATRTFQALRMAVNGELGQLRIFLEKIMDWLPVGGRLAIISFHSLEDRMVKRAMRKWAGEGVFSRAGAPVLARQLFKKPLAAGEAELAANPRSGCAKLRAVEKVAEFSHAPA